MQSDRRATKRKRITSKGKKQPSPIIQPQKPLPQKIVDAEQKSDESSPILGKKSKRTPSKKAEPEIRIQPPRKNKKPRQVKPTPQKKAAKPNLIAIRTRPTGPNKKTSVRLSDSFADLKTPERKAISAAISKENKAISSHTEMGPIIEMTPGEKHIQSAYTPGRENILFLETVLPGFARFYTTDEDAISGAPPVEDISPKNLSALFESKAGKAVKATKQSSQEMEVIVTSELLKKSFATYVKNLFRRKTSQAKVVANKGKQKDAKATAYLRAAAITDEYIKANWTHLVAHSVLNEKAQIEENLCAATAHANTNMMFIEGRYNLIADAYPEGYTLKVRAELIPNTKIATWIYVTIETSDFTLNIKLNAQESNKPQAVNDAYSINIVKSLVNYKKQVKVAAQDNKPDSLYSSKSCLFKTKEEHQKPSITDKQKIHEKKPVKKSK